MSEFRRRKAQDRLQEAEAALAREDFAAAEQAFSHALRLDPSTPAGWISWAECRERQGQLIEAARILGDGLAHHGEDPALQLAWARAQIEIGQFAGAESISRALCERWPGQRPPLAHLARALRDTRSFAALRALLEQALAGSFAGDRELEALLASCRGWQGEGAAADAADLGPRSGSGWRRPETMRERLRADFGVILLGTGHDDGLAIPWYSTYLCTPFDVVATCARLLAVAEQLGWRWQQVASIDPAAAVLAELLAGARSLPVCDLDDEPEPDPETTLAVASFVAPGWQHDRARHGPWARRCAEAGNLFAFGALDYARHGELLPANSAPSLPPKLPLKLPPILGLAAGERVCLPWWRLGEARIGFSRSGLIDPLPPEIDGRPPARIAEDHRRALAGYACGPGFALALRDLHAHRDQLQPGLRRRSDFARIPPLPSQEGAPRGPGPGPDLDGSADAFFRALAGYERDPQTVDAAVWERLEARFVANPEVRSRLADLLYRVDPARFTAVLEALVDRPAAELPWAERDGLLHLFGCNPWGARAGAVLERWLSAGAMSNRSEIVQSKYGLHHLAEASGSPERFAAVLTRLLADEVPIVLGTVRWLHDNPQHHDHAILLPLLLPLLEHAHADVVFEVLQCARVAKLALPLARIEPCLQHRHPRLRAAAIEYLEFAPELHGDDSTRARLTAWLDDDEPVIVWAAARSLIRGGSAAARIEGARAITRRILTPTVAEPIRRELLRALVSAERFEALEAALAFSDSPSHVKILAAAAGPALLAFDDPRLLPHLRRHVDAFGLDPPRGYARYLARHGDPTLDRAAVHGAQGATDLDAGYEAKAVLARWGDAAARAELRRALDYAPSFAAAAYEASFAVLGARDWTRLEAGRDDPRLADRTWSILVAGLRPEAGDWLEDLAAALAGHPERARSWARFIVDRLRAQLPGKFVVGAVSADYGVLARLLPAALEALLEARLGAEAVPDRVSVDLFEWLARAQPERARERAPVLLASPHWGLRQAARRAVGDPSPAVAVP